MSKKTRSIERKWINNFKKSPLVDKDNDAYQSGYAYQLFYGKQVDSYYPDDFPHGFHHFCNSCNAMDRDVALQRLIAYLSFIGIRLRKEAVLNHLQAFPDDFQKLKTKCYYIFKTLAHFGNKLDIENPYRDNGGDLYFLLRIESEESLHGGQLNLFEDIELPALYKKITNIPTDMTTMW